MKNYTPRIRELEAHVNLLIFCAYLARSFLHKNRPRSNFATVILTFTENTFSYCYLRKCDSRSRQPAMRYLKEYIYSLEKLPETCLRDNAREVRERSLSANVSERVDLVTNKTLFIITRDRCTQDIHTDDARHDTRFVGISSKGRTSQKRFC